MQKPAAWATQTARPPTPMLHRRKKDSKTQPVHCSPFLPPRPAPGVAVRFARTSILLLGALALAACSTERSRRRDLLERVQPPQPTLSATASFDAGALQVESWLGPSVRLKKGEKGEKGPGEGFEAPRGGMTRPRFNSISEAGTEYENADDPFEQGGNNYTSAEIEEMYGRVNYEYILPPRLALTFFFINRGPQPLTLTIADVNSLLGNFAARPASLTLAPGERATVDPMLSNLESNFDGLDVTISLRFGKQTETKVLQLRRVDTAPPARPSGG
jgi:hypothetical protein